MFRSLGNLWSPAADRARLSILIYHRVLATPDPILHDEMDAALFDKQMGALAAAFNVLPLDEACRRIALKSLPARAVSITFDDGYADNEEVALPILKRHGLTATFFVSPGYSDGGAMFNDVVIEAVRLAPAGAYDLSDIGAGQVELGDSGSRRDAIDRVIKQIKHRPPAERSAIVGDLTQRLRSGPTKSPMMSPAQIRRLFDAGMGIGAHTINHPILASVGEDEARAEIVGSKRRLEEITGAPVTLFAYPNGMPGRDYGPEHVRLVKEAGFAAAASTEGGVAHSGTDLFQLPRFGLYERSAVRLTARMFAGYVRPIAA